MSARVEKFQSDLYRIYRFTSSVTHYLRKRVRPLGWMLCCMFPFVLFIMLSYIKVPAFLLMSMMIALVIVAFLFVLLRRGKCQITRDLPSLATAGSEVKYQVKVKNTGKSVLSGTLLMDEESDYRPKKDEFVKSREPDEHLRNSFDRLFAYYRWMWICDKKRQRETKPHLLENLKGDEETTLTMSCKPLRRGVMQFSTMKLILPEPLGVFQKIAKVEQQNDHLIVLPKRYILPDLDLTGSSRNQMGGEVASQSAGQVGEFIGLRDYKPGDPMKLIHWRSYAKTGKPIVKEYEDVFFPRCGLVLDTDCPFQEVEKFEEAVSIAASFASSVDTKESLLDLIFLNQGAKVQTVGKGVAKVEQMLETLASVEVDLTPDWKSLTQKVLVHAEQLSSCIVILTNTSPEKLEMIQKWRSSGMSLLVVALCADEEEKSVVASHGFFPVTVQHIQRDLMRLAE